MKRLLTLSKSVVVLTLPLIGVRVRAQSEKTIANSTVSDANVNLASAVKFEDHFSEWNAQTPIIDRALNTAGVVAIDVVAAVALILPSIELDEHVYRLQKLSDGVKLVDKKAIALNRRRLANIRWSKRISKVAYVGGLYFLVDGAAGVVVAIRGNQPIYVGNLPALASYLARKNFEGSSRPASREVHDQLKLAITQASANVAN